MNYQIVRNAEICLAQSLIKEHQVRLTWSREHILNEQLSALKKLLSHAKQYSQWHRQRLDGIDINNFGLEQLASLPTMNKKDVMENWDQIVTTTDLSLEKANQFLISQHEPSYFLDQYHFYATGGSSGTRGVFAWDKLSFANFVSFFFRYQFRDDYLKNAPEKKYVVAVIAAEHAIHMSTPLFSVPLLPNVKIHLTPATWPLAKLVSELNTLKPTHLIGYTSALHRLAEQAEKGNLLFKPERVSVNSEPLFQETLTLFKKVWNVPVNNMWASTDGGPHAGNCDYSNDLHVNEDAVIIEPNGDKILLTNLINPLIPLIRYEIDDKVSFSENKCACGSNFKMIKQIMGRMDDDFIYKNGITISTEDFETILYSIPGLAEYQIFQTDHGADISIIAAQTIDLQAVIIYLTNLYQQKGFERPVIQVELTDQLKRHPQTGKLRRFVPLKK